MAKKQQPEISGAIRFGGKVYRKGMEEEFSKDAQAAGMKESQLNRLIEKGAITGIEPVKESAKTEEADSESKSAAGSKSTGDKAKETK